MRTNECRVNNVSVVCPAVRAGLASTMPARRLWGRHRFRHTPYGDDENVVDRVCTTRPPGTPAVATKMPLVSKPPPRQYLAHKVNVVNSVRVVCPAENSSGDHAAKDTLATQHLAMQRRE